MFPMMYPTQAPPPAAPQRPWLTWLLTLGMGILLWRGGLIPGLPPIPPLPSVPPFANPQPPAQVPPQQPAPVPPQPPARNPADAIGRITFGRSGCTAAAITPRLSDGRYHVLTAAHCVEGPGQTGTFRLKDGRTVGLTVLAIDKRSDAAWCITSTNSVELPALALADKLPTVGDRIWHAGYGFDKPTNREDGRVTNSESADGQTEFSISVSSGDSGGPFMLDENGRVVGCVCCTTRIAGVGRVWGASVNSITRLRPRGLTVDAWIPSPVPDCSQLKKD